MKKNDNYNDTPPRRSLTIASLTSSERLESILTQCRVKPADKLDLPYKQCRALWDTGATFGGVSPELIKEWGIKPDGYCVIEAAVGDKTLQPFYYLLARFDDGAAFPFKATPVSNKRFEILVGMDIINTGTFLIERTDDDGTRFTFTFME